MPRRRRLVRSTPPNKGMKQTKPAQAMELRSLSPVLSGLEAMSMTPDGRLRQALESIFMLPVRLRHRRSARVRHRVRVGAIATVRKTLAGAKEHGTKGLAVFMNVGLYLLLLDDDLAHFTDGLISANSVRQRRFLAKDEAILLHEAAEDLPQLLGRDFRAAVKLMGATTDQITRLNSVSSDLSTFWRERRALLGSIRNMVGAHREHDALQYLESLEAIEPLDVMGQAAELSQLLRRLLDVLVDIAPLASSPRVILRDMANSRESGGAG